MTTNDWITQAKKRGLGNALETALDIFAPLGPLGAQLLWMTQPAFRLMGGINAAQTLHALAESLETPEGIAALRAQLRDDES
jgi:hypothetical protein